ncbi:hypothetical protein AGDE_12154 [Angomonas deanei]|nr:hypothetical protein AGDE_12154 [Angomonas deanei]|eukprot:EPY24823.1 hypothetical protein AGDE_12154 [Angomonas deanei]
MRQLKGDAKIGSTRLCRPFQYPEDFDDDTAEQKFVKITKPDGTVLVRSYKEMIYNPCGLAAWSKFNDTLRLYKVASPEDYAADPSAYVMGGVSGTVPLELICDGGDFDATGEPIAPAPGQRCHKKGVGMKADLKVRYRPITPREDWWSLRYPYPTDNEFLNQGFYNNEAGHSMPDLMDVDLHVWMRSSLLNQFKKLYRVIDVDLQPGTYMLQVDEFFDTVSFRGKKGFALRCKWWVGENNTALGILYLALGACCLILGVAFGIEFCLQKKGMNRLSTMKEPRRSWYLHDPQSPQMEAYFNRRLHRHIPFAELNALRA